MTVLDLLPFALIGVEFWLLIVRPAKARRDEQAALMGRLAPGQRVITTAGVFATVVEVDPERVHLEIAPGVVIQMVPQAIGRIVADAAPDADHPGDADPPAVTAPQTEVSAEPSPEADRG